MTPSVQSVIEAFPPWFKGPPPSPLVTVSMSEEQQAESEETLVGMRMRA